MREHVTSGTDCWCGPRIEAVCEECDGDGCWRCENVGTITIYSAEDSTAPLIIVHHDSDPEQTGLPMINEPNA